MRHDWAREEGWTDPLGLRHFFKEGSAFWECSRCGLFAIGMGDRPPVSIELIYPDCGLYLAERVHRS